LGAWLNREDDRNTRNHSEFLTDPYNGPHVYCCGVAPSTGRLQSAVDLNSSDRGRPPVERLQLRSGGSDKCARGAGDGQAGRSCTVLAGPVGGPITVAVSGRQTSGIGSGLSRAIAVRGGWGRLTITGRR